MSTYSYPAFRPELAKPQGTFGLPSFGAYAAYGAADAPLEELRFWSTRAASAASTIRTATGMGVSNAAGLLFQAAGLATQANALVSEARNDPAKWTRAHEEKIAGLLEKARVQYNGAAGIASTQSVTFPKFPTWRLAQAGVPEGGAVATDVATSGTLEQIMAGFLQGIQAVNATKTNEAADDAQQAGAAAGLTPEQQAAAAAVLLGGLGLGIWGLTRLFR
jgi:hypothetical protein